MDDDESSPSALDKNTQNVKFVHVGAVLVERHHKSDAYVLRACGFVFDVNGVCAGGHVCEDGWPCVLPQH